MKNNNGSQLPKLTSLRGRSPDGIGTTDEAIYSKGVSRVKRGTSSIRTGFLALLGMILRVRLLRSLRSLAMTDTIKSLIVIVRRRPLANLGMYNNGLTLIEVVLAMSLLTLILFAGSSIYLSGMNLSVDAQYSAQAHRNAEIVMMHIQKNACDGAGHFEVSSDNKGVGFKVYPAISPDFSQEPPITMQYSFNADLNQIIFTRTITESQTVMGEEGEIVAGGGGGEELVFNHITDCSFSTFQNDGIVLVINIEASDNNNSEQNKYKLNTCIEAGLSAG